MPIRAIGTSTLADSISTRTPFSTTSIIAKAPTVGVTREATTRATRTATTAGPLSEDTTITASARENSNARSYRLDHSEGFAQSKDLPPYQVKEIVPFRETRATPKRRSAGIGDSNDNF